MFRILGAELGEAGIAQFTIFPYPVAFHQHFRRRHRIGENLRIIAEALDHLASHIEVMDRRDFTDALADIGMAAVDDLIEDIGWAEKGIGAEPTGLTPPEV